LLAWDSFNGHLGDDTKRILKKMKTDLAVIPGGLISALQVLDVSVNKPFKDVRKLHSMDGRRWTYMTPTGKIRSSIEMMCEWVVRAWDTVSPEVIMKSFLKTGIPNVLDGSENDDVD
jgi:hypothetical protein